ncbi:MAG: PDZ domain-containing protein [Myxococcales bacterium]|nr:PDZ domain-containing protein [Myxococcales bacterium]
MSSRFILSAALLLALGACEPVLDADLLVVGGLEPEWLSEGASLRVRGEGFPAGARGALELVGQIHRPGQSPAPLRLEIPCRALRADLVELRAGRELLERAGGRGTFQGALTLRFPDADGQGTVSGTLAGARLDFIPSSARGIATNLDRARRSERLASSLGLRLSGASEAERGLLVMELAEGGPAASAGLREGDRLVALGGLRLMELSDLVPPGEARLLALGVRRAGLVGELPLRIPLEAGRGLGASPSKQAPMLIAGLLLLLLLLAPTARLFDGARAAPGPSLRPGAPLPPGSHRLLRAIALIGPACAIFALVAWIGGLRSELQIVHLLGVALALRLIATASGPSEPSKTRPWGRLGLSRFAAGSLATLSSLSVMAMLAGGLEQGLYRLDPTSGGPGWLLLREPLALLALPVYLLGCPGERSAREGRVSQIASHAELLLWAALGGLVWLGGSPRGAVASAIFVLGAGALMAISVRLRAALDAPRRAWVGPLGLFLLGLAFAQASLGAPLSPSMAPWILGGALGLAALRALLALLRSQGRRSAPLVHPFL